MIYPLKPEAQAKEDFACASGFNGRERYSSGVGLVRHENEFVQE